MTKRSNEFEEKSELAIFSLAIEITNEDLRTELVHNRCGNDIKLAKRVFSLLSKAIPSHAASAIESHSASSGEATSQEHDDKTPSFTHPFEFTETEIGPYSVIKRIGEGGISEVFLAQQSFPIQRQVAIKLIKPGMESNSIVARFKLEQHALELLSHHGIAGLLDAGTSPLGRQYLVLEYIPGEPITEFCQRNNLSPTEKLCLFLDVCEAVQHAHQRGIIHRDIKPNNILVASEDGKPVPKIIDFGIAKLLDIRDARTNNSQSKHRTQFGQLVGTLEYMSPEQASLGRSVVDIRADVYALSCVLYELLTGKAPLAAVLAKSGSVADALNSIREEVPTRPLLALKEEPSRSSIGTVKWGDDLDWIVLKGLEKAIEDRYPTVHEFVADLRRYLRHEAVLARPQTPLYLLTRFASRYRAAMVTFAIVSLSLCFAFGVSVWGWTTTYAANKKVEAKATEAIEMQQRAENILAFFLAGVEKSKPRTESTSNLPDMTVEQLVTTYLDDLKKSLDTKPTKITPDVAIEILSRLGKVALSRFEPKPAISAYEKLVELLEQYQPNNPQRMFDEKAQLANSYYVGHDILKAQDLLASICPTEATNIVEGEAIDLLARTYLHADGLIVAERIHKRIPLAIRSPKIDLTRSDILHRFGHNQEAYELISKTLQEVDGDVEMTSKCSGVLGMCLFGLGRNEEALEVYKRLAQDDKGTFSRNHLGSYDGRGQLMDAYIKCRQYDNALEVAMQLRVDLEQESESAPMRRFLPMLRLRMTQCLLGLKRTKELLENLDEPSLESQLRDREKFELTAYVAMAMILEGRKEEAGPLIQKNQALVSNVSADSFMWNYSRRKVKAMQEQLHFSVDFGLVDAKQDIENQRPGDANSSSP